MTDLPVMITQNVALTESVAMPVNASSSPMLRQPPVLWRHQILSGTTNMATE
jgi:hypothetical protein